MFHFILTELVRISVHFALVSLILAAIVFVTMCPVMSALQERKVLANRPTNLCITRAALSIE